MSRQAPFRLIRFPDFIDAPLKIDFLTVKTPRAPGVGFSCPVGTPLGAWGIPCERVHVALRIAVDPGNLREKVTFPLGRLMAALQCWDRGNRCKPIFPNRPVFPAPCFGKCEPGGGVGQGGAVARPGVSRKALALLGPIASLSRLLSRPSQDTVFCRWFKKPVIGCIP